MCRKEMRRIRAGEPHDPDTAAPGRRGYGDDGVFGNARDGSAPGHIFTGKSVAGPRLSDRPVYRSATRAAWTTTIAATTAAPVISASGTPSAAARIPPSAAAALERRRLCRRHMLVALAVDHDKAPQP